MGKETDKVAAESLTAITQEVQKKKEKVDIYELGVIEGVVPAPPKKKRGAPNLYDELYIDEYLDEIEDMYARGLTHAEFVREFNETYGKLSVATLNNWLKYGRPLNKIETDRLEQGKTINRTFDPKYADFCKAVDRGRRVAKKFLQKRYIEVISGDYKQTKVFVGVSEGKLLVHQYEEPMIPDVSAMERRLFNFDKSKLGSDEDETEVEDTMVEFEISISPEQAEEIERLTAASLETKEGAVDEED